MSLKEKPNEEGSNSKKDLSSSAHSPRFSLAELLDLPVISAMYRGSRLVRELNLESEQFPDISCTEGMLKDPAYLAFKRLSWEASMRTIYKNNTQLGFGFNQEVKASQNLKNEAARKLALLMSSSFERFPDMYKDWMN